MGAVQESQTTSEHNGGRRIARADLMAEIDRRQLIKQPGAEVEEFHAKGGPADPGPPLLRAFVQVELALVHPAMAFHGQARRVHVGDAFEWLRRVGLQSRPYSVDVPSFGPCGPPPAAWRSPTA